MKSKLLLILVLLLPILSYSQTNGLRDITLSANAGVNYSTIKNSIIDFRPGARPYIGMSVSYPIANRVSIKGVANYSMKSSNSLSPNLKVENQYIDFEFSPRVEIFHNVYLQAGIIHSTFLKSNLIVRNGDKWNGVERIPATGYGSETNFLTGVEFKIQDNVNLELNYIIPGGRMNTSNFQFGINIALNNRSPKETSYRKKRKIESQNQILQMKESVLLVRLKTAENKINALKKVGMDEKAEMVRSVQEFENKSIISAFNKYFNFCPVQFFFSNHSVDVKNRRFDGIFLDDSLQVDASIKLDTNIRFMVADFSSIEQDTAKYLSHYSYETVGEDVPKKVSSYYTSSTEFDFDALRILDHNFVQLNKPFPYYTAIITKRNKRSKEETSIKKPPHMGLFIVAYDQTVADMNWKLKQYYKRKNKKRRVADDL